MKIGIDAKWYFEGPPSGVNVVRNLVNSLILENKNDQLFIFLNCNSKNEPLFFKNQKNVTVIYIPSKLNIITNLFFFPFYSFRMKLDIILFQNYIPLFKLGKTKYFNYVHDFLFLDFPLYFSKLELVLYKFILLSVKKSDHVITISHTEQKRIMKHTGFKDSKISYVYHGIDKIFNPTLDKPSNIVLRKYGLPDTYILYVGRINVRKNIENLLKAFQLLLKEYNINLVLVGKVENNNFNINDTLIDLNIENNVFVLGHIPDNDLGRIYSGAKFFVFPSFAEGFGLPPLEAMNLGIPTIVSRIQPFIELFGNSVLYFNPTEHLELLKKMRFLLSNENLILQYSTRGKETAKSFSWNKSANDLIMIFSKYGIK